MSWGKILSPVGTGPAGSAGADGNTFQIVQDGVGSFSARSANSFIDRYFLNADDGNLYEQLASAPVATNLGTVKGSDGINGSSTQILSGAVAPDNTADGVDGDFYIDTSNGDFYGPKGATTTGIWDASTVNFTGLTGAAGSNGVDVSSANVNSSGELTITLSDSTEVNAGQVATDIGIPFVFSSSTTDADQNPSNRRYNKVVTVASSAFSIDGVSQPTLELIEDNTYIFDQNDASNLAGSGPNHVIAFSETSDGTHNSGVEYTTGITSVGKTFELAVTSATPAILYYYCKNHSGMGGQININAQAGAVIEGSGKFYASNADLTTIDCQFFIDNEDAESNSVTSWVDSFTSSTNDVKGQLFISKKSDPSAWTIIPIESIADGTGYDKITIPTGSSAQSSSASPFADGDRLGVFFVQAGDKGDTGSNAIVNSITAVTLDSAADATVANTGSTTSADIVLGLPRGKDGRAGIDGLEGIGIKYSDGTPRNDEGQIGDFHLSIVDESIRVKREINHLSEIVVSGANFIADDTDLDPNGTYVFVRFSEGLFTDGSLITKGEYSLNRADGLPDPDYTIEYDFIEYAWELRSKTSPTPPPLAKIKDLDPTGCAYYPILTDFGVNLNNYPNSTMTPPVGNYEGNPELSYEEPLVEVIGSTVDEGERVPLNLRNQTFTIPVTAVEIDGEKKFQINSVAGRTLSISEGSTYVFDLSDSSLSGHSFKISETSDGTLNGGVDHVDGIIESGIVGSSGASLSIRASADTPDLYYYCSNHAGMGGTIYTTPVLASAKPQINAASALDQSISVYVVTSTAINVTDPNGSLPNSDYEGLYTREIAQHNSKSAWKNSSNKYITFHSSNWSIRDSLSGAVVQKISDRELADPSLATFTEASVHVYPTIESIDADGVLSTGSVPTIISLEAGAKLSLDLSNLVDRGSYPLVYVERVSKEDSSVIITETVVQSRLSCWQVALASSTAGPSSFYLNDLVDVETSYPDINNGAILQFDAFDNLWKVGDFVTSQWTVAPSDPFGDGINGEFYLNSSTKKLYRFVAESWTEIADLTEGAAGNGISSVEHTDGDTLLFTFDDGSTFETDSIRGTAGVNGAAGGLPLGGSSSPTGSGDGTRDWTPTELSTSVWADFSDNSLTRKTGLDVHTAFSKHGSKSFVNETGLNLPSQDLLASKNCLNFSGSDFLELSSPISPNDAEMTIIGVFEIGGAMSTNDGIFASLSHEVGSIQMADVFSEDETVTINDGSATVVYTAKDTPSGTNEFPTADISASLSALTALIADSTNGNGSTVFPVVDGSTIHFRMIASGAVGLNSITSSATDATVIDFNQPDAEAEISFDGTNLELKGLENDGTPFNHTLISTPANDAKPIICIQIKGTSVVARVNGTQVFDEAITVTGIAPQRFILGENVDRDSRLSAKHGEWIINKGLMSSDEIEKTEGYLKAKWTGSLDASHEYVNTAPSLKGGSQGQILMKIGEGDYDVAWRDSTPYNNFIATADNKKVIVPLSAHGSTIVAEHEAYQAAITIVLPYSPPDGWQCFIINDNNMPVDIKALDAGSDTERLIPDAGFAVQLDPLTRPFLIEKGSACTATWNNGKQKWHIIGKLGTLADAADVLTF